jgi:hypothetical protein
LGGQRWQATTECDLRIDISTDFLASSLCNRPRSRPAPLPYHRPLGCQRLGILFATAVCGEAEGTSYLQNDGRSISRSSFKQLKYTRFEAKQCFRCVPRCEALRSGGILGWATQKIEHEPKSSNFCAYRRHTGTSAVMALLPLQFQYSLSRRLLSPERSG